MKAIIFLTSEDTDEECVRHSKSDKKQMMFDNKVDKVIKELFKSLLLDIIWTQKYKLFCLDYVD